MASSHPQVPCGRSGAFPDRRSRAKRHAPEGAAQNANSAEPSPGCGGQGLGHLGSISRNLPEA